MTQFHKAMQALLLAAKAAAQLALAVVVGLSIWPAAQAQLALFPTRIVFENNQRAAQVELMNTGAEPATYRVNLVNRRMGEHGEFIAIDSPGPGELFAGEMLRFSPQQVVIQPGSSQTVRVLVRKPTNLAPGEYRSHLQFDRVPDARGSTNVESLGRGGAGEQVGVVIQALVGASIPIIVRHGDTQAGVTITELALQPPGSDGKPALALQLNRTGNRSTYGDLVVHYVPRGGSPLEVALAGGVAVYAPNTLRRARMPLQLPVGVVLAGGVLEVTYRERAESGGRALAQGRLPLP